jgi:shikimate dehydrogenase
MRIFGLIGNPLTHSFSARYFAKKFADEHITETEYRNFPLQDISELTTLLAAHPALRGINLTIPFKEVVIPFLDVQNDIVQNIGACNCIDIRNGQLFGHNTDVAGFRESFMPMLRPGSHRALVLGTGGASKAVLYVLKELNIPTTVVTRARKEQEQLTYDELTIDVIRDFSVIVNTTPLGTYPKMNESPAIPYEGITSKHYCYDLVYNPAVTQFLGEAERRGARICNGADMLRIQAEESWEIWNS